MTLFQNLILFTNHYGNLQEMLEMASFLKFVDLYLTSEWGPVLRGTSCIYTYTHAPPILYSWPDDTNNYFVSTTIMKSPTT
jgi:hypothetical protein